MKLKMLFLGLFVSLSVFGQQKIDNLETKVFTNKTTATFNTSLSGVAKLTSGLLSAGTVSNSDIDSAAAIAYSKFASMATGQVLLGNAGVPTATTLSGGATVGATGVVTLGNSAVITQLLTGYTSGAGTVSASDSILGAIQKLDGNNTLNGAYLKSTSPHITTSLGAVDFRNGAGVDTANVFRIQNIAGNPTALFTGAGEATVKALRFTDPLSSRVTGVTSDLASLVQFIGAESTNTWSTGNNATVMGGGTLQGSFVKVSNGQLKGVESYRFTQAAGSLNDYWCTPVIDVPTAYKNVTLYYPTTYTYNGSNAEILPSIYDVTNSSTTTVPLNSTTGLDAALNISTSFYYATIPSATNQVRLCYQVKTLNSGKAFNFIDLGLTKTLSQFGVLSNYNSIDATLVTITSNFTNSTTTAWVTRRGDRAYFEGIVLLSGTPGAADLQLTLPSGYVIDINKVPNSANLRNTFGIAWIYDSSPGLTYYGQVRGTGTTTVQINRPIVSTSGQSAAVDNVNPITFASSDSIMFKFDVPIVGWQGTNASVASTLDQVSSDTMTFSFKSTAIVDSDPVGTYNTYSYAANSNTPVICGTAPTTVPSNANGAYIFAKAYNVASNCSTSISRFDFFVGKNLKSYNAFAYGNTGKVTPLNYMLASVGTTDIYGSTVTYSETTGILSIESAISPTTANTVRRTGASQSGTYPTNAYFTFSASKTPSLASLPILGNNYTPGLNDGIRIEPFMVDFGTTNGTTPCTASPCSYLNQIGNAVNSITRSSSGAYVINVGKTYTKLKCVGSVFSDGAVGSATMETATCSTCNGLNFYTRDSNTDALSDARGTLSCMGQL